MSNDTQAVRTAPPVGTAAMRAAMKIAGGLGQNERLQFMSMLSDGASWLMMVKHFHLTYNQPIHIGPPSLDHMSINRKGMRMDLIAEEFKELANALDQNDLIETADALGDLIYVICGFAVEAGIDLTRVMKEIHASNLTKLDQFGKPIFREDGKVLKGPNYVKPDIAAALGIPSHD